MQTQEHFWLKIAGIGALIAIGVYFFINHTTDNVPNENAVAEQANAYDSGKISRNETQFTEATENKTLSPDDSDSAQLISPELQERVAAMDARRPNHSYSNADIAAAVARTTTWAPTDTTHRELPLAEEEFTDGRQFVDLDSLKIETLMPGDQVNVRVDENAKDYKVTIDRVEKHDYNSISWYGHIEGDDGQRYQVSFTRGEHLTVGGLDTPDGHFVIQAHGNKGWIASSQLLFKQDTSVSDAINPADVDPNYQHNGNQHNHTH